MANRAGRQARQSSGRPPGRLSLAILALGAAALSYRAVAILDAEVEASPIVVLASFHIDPATAPVDEWALLPMIGPALAQRIVAARDERGGFATIDDLAEVRGVGPVTLEAIAPHLRFETHQQSRDARRRSPSSRAPADDRNGLGPP